MVRGCVARQARPINMSLTQTPSHLHSWVLQQSITCVVTNCTFQVRGATRTCEHVRRKQCERRSSVIRDDSWPENYKVNLCHGCCKEERCSLKLRCVFCTTTFLLLERWRAKDGNRGSRTANCDGNVADAKDGGALPRGRGVLGGGTRISQSTVTERAHLPPCRVSSDVRKVRRQRALR